MAQAGCRDPAFVVVQDATIVRAFAQLTAATLGLGRDCLGAFDDDEARLRPIALLPIGYPAESPHQASRRSLSDLGIT